MRRAPLFGLASLLLVVPAPASTQVAPPPLCRALITAADDFIVDVYHNGAKIPDDRRELLEELHGATADRWSACDDPALVAAFIADRDFLSARRARPIAVPWSDGDSKMAHHADGWSGRPLWGESRNTWIKYVAR
ncbi:hypothetical protein TA3x_000075 [Tundrisphaera sp. TA3]|uniref:hypothetical protein n=1 Tax=Tundrisphaera sp. TA3 TaxID=3435775 RepID=UPI003EBCB6F1